MQKKKLNKFIILSVAFHVILISAVLLYFIKNPVSGGKSGTVMVGVISTGDSAQNKTSSSSVANNAETTKQESNTKIALEKKQVKKTVKNKKTPEKKVQKESTKPAKKKTESANKDTPATASNSKDINKSKTGTEIASTGQNGTIETNNPGYNGSKDSLAYPNYNLNPKPKYPRVARKRGYEGEVKLKVFVLADGKVGKIEVLRPSGHRVLDEEAIEAVKDWIFVPGKQDGKEISSWVTVPITFQLKSG